VDNQPQTVPRRPNDALAAGTILTGVTVHRVGPAQEATRRDLGRVLVTIDDLDVLMTVLTSMVGMAAAKIKVEFDGGYFTQAEELRTLSDMEMKNLRLKTPKLEVILSPSAAIAVGDQQEAENVYKWALKRQTRQRPPRQRPRRMRLADNLGYIGLVVLTVASSCIFVIPLLRPAPPVSLETAATIVSLFIVGGWCFWRLQRENTPSYALIIPLSNTEHNQSHLSQMYPRRTWIVAIVSAIIAVLAVAAAVWIKVTSK
jgi:hypothetical protein